ncbi:hypothetical protein [uncultured Tateyamaria sp.]|uniref:hypothetical protein n=1 Tax=uncultured Tateyamaria sp. TaxID=455651 RepID=UPI002610234D|nr:hypothetical protein [uncultured Tateyamaria sp.]
MPRSKKPDRKPGDTRTTSKPRQAVAEQRNLKRHPDHAARGQIRGGRPPRFPGRTGGR